LRSMLLYSLYYLVSLFLPENAIRMREPRRVRRTGGEAHSGMVAAAAWAVKRP